MPLADRIHAALLDDLTATIEDTRDDVDAAQLSTALLQWEGGHRSLVGLTHDCHRAVYFDETVSLIHSFPVPEGELRAREEIRSETAEDRPAAYAHVRQRGPQNWDWVHPRYRWVFDLAVPESDG